MQKNKVSNKEIVKRIVDGLDQKLNSVVVDQKKLQEFLVYMSGFYQGRSFNNMMLIYFTKPDARIVATYKQWIDKNRIVVACTVCRAFKNNDCVCVERSRPTRIEQLRPIQRNIKVDNKQEDDALQVSYTTFYAYYVFDISDTEALNDDGIAVEDPRLPAKLVGSDGAEIFDAVKNYVEADGWQFIVEVYKDASNGYTTFEEKVIKIQADMDMKAKASVSLHELAHKLMHEKINYKTCRDIAEVEAESVSYIVSQFYGLDCGDHNIKYIDGWGDGKTKSLFRNSLNDIFKTATKIIDELKL